MATTFAFDGVLRTAVVINLTSNSGDWTSRDSAHVSSISSQMSVSKITGIFSLRDDGFLSKAHEVNVTKNIARIPNTIRLIGFMERANPRIPLFAVKGLVPFIVKPPYFKKVLVLISFANIV
jgi:hypothetical protein